MRFQWKTSSPFEILKVIRGKRSDTWGVRTFPTSYGNLIRPIIWVPLVFPLLRHVPLPMWIVILCLYINFVSTIINFTLVISNQMHGKTNNLMFHQPHPPVLLQNTTKSEFSFCYLPKKLPFLLSLKRYTFKMEYKPYIYKLLLLNTR